MRKQRFSTKDLETKFPMDILEGIQIQNQEFKKNTSGLDLFSMSPDQVDGIHFIFNNVLTKTEREIATLLFQSKKNCTEVGEIRGTSINSGWISMKSTMKKMSAKSCIPYYIHGLQGYNNILKGMTYKDKRDMSVEMLLLPEHLIKKMINKGIIKISDINNITLMHFNDTNQAMIKYALQRVYGMKQENLPPLKPASSSLNLDNLSYVLKLPKDKVSMIIKLYDCDDKIDVSNLTIADAFWIAGHADAGCSLDVFKTIVNAFNIELHDSYKDIVIEKQNDALRSKDEYIDKLTNVVNIIDDAYKSIHGIKESSSCQENNQEQCPNKKDKVSSIRKHDDTTMYLPELTEEESKWQTGEIKRIKKFVGSTTGRTTKSVLSSIYDIMRNEYGIVFEQEKKEIREKFDIDKGQKISTLRLISYEPKLRSLFTPILTDIINSETEN